jgi:hypothetical protein
LLRAAEAELARAALGQAILEQNGEAGAVRDSPLGLTDSQLASVMAAAGGLPREKRDVFLQRIAGYLTLYGGCHPTDDDVDRAIRVALVQLVQAMAA